MFFVLSKTVGYFLTPSNSIFAILFVGAVLLFTRWRRGGGRLVILSVTLMILLGCLPVGRWLAVPLETRFPPWDPSRGPPDGIVVLGGAIDPGLSRSYAAPQLNASAERVTVIAKLAREFPNARIVYSGGNAALFPSAPPEADFVLPLLESFGVPRGRVTLETRSRNTYENAVFSKELVKPKPGERWLLVTSAQHMPRAIGCFRRVGFKVEAYPVDWTVEPGVSLSFNYNVLNGIGAVDGISHEWVGLLAYWLTGRTSSLLPGPAPAR